MEMMVGQDQQPQQVAVEKKPLWEDVIDVFVSPFQLFKRQANESWVKPWLVLSVIFAVLYIAFMGPNGELSIATAREMMARVGKELPAAAQQPPSLVRGILAAVIGQPLAVLVFGGLMGGFLLWAASAVAGGGPRFKQAMTIVLWAAFPGILQKVISGVLVLIKSNSGAELSAADASTGILRFISPASVPIPVYTALAMVDIFVLWQVILWAVALKAVCNYSTGKASAVAVATWLLTLLPLMAIGFLSQMLMGMAR